MSDYHDKTGPLATIDIAGLKRFIAIAISAGRRSALGEYLVRPFDEFTWSISTAIRGRSGVRREGRCCLPRTT